MRGLDPRVHVFLRSSKDADGRNKCGHAGWNALSPFNPPR
jgi:hypothetical protein